mgnify:CR=1 FL=1
MKQSLFNAAKILSLCLFMTFGISCSNNDDDVTANAEISYVVNGQTVAFNVVGTTESTIISSNGEPVPVINISGGITGDSANSISFQVFVDQVGQSALVFNFIQLTYNGVEYSVGNSSNFNFNLIVNDGTRLQGTFAGTFDNFNGDAIIISDGQFNIDR